MLNDLQRLGLKQSLVLLLKAGMDNEGIIEDIRATLVHHLKEDHDQINAIMSGVTTTINNARAKQIKAREWIEAVISNDN